MVPGRRRLRVLAGLGVAALALHAALLGELEWTWPAGAPRRATLSVRTLVRPAMRPLPEEAPEREPTASVAPDPPAPPAARAVAASPRPAPRRPRESVPDPHADVPPIDPAATQAPDASADPRGAPAEHLRVATASAASVVADAEPIPLYSTRPPPPASVYYAFRRGSSSGTAVLRWAPGSDGYALQFEGRIGDAVVISQVSEGAFDTAGLAPARYTDRRQRGRRLATNFRREAGTISYSGSAEEHPLASGAQDRLSWLLQLASIVAAEPARRIAGAAVVMAVAGLRGPPDVWAFRCEGIDGRAAIRFVRESRGLYDSRIEVWLDPARDFMPVRVLMTTSVEAQALEIVLDASAREADAALSEEAGSARPALAFRPGAPK